MSILSPCLNESIKATFIENGPAIFVAIDYGQREKPQSYT